MIRTARAAAFAAASVAAGAAFAQDSQDETVDVGMLLTLSGPPAALGEHIRDGFMLALERMDGKLGGFETDVTVVDDELKPDVAVDRARQLVERDEADVVLGTVFSNVMMAIFRPVTEAGVLLVSPNAGPAPLAGRGCHPLHFNVAWQNDTNHEVLGAHANAEGYESLVLVAPNYQAGKDAMAGVKRFYEGEVKDEIFTQLGQLDFSAELARIASMSPDAVYAFMPGGMGVNLVRQYDQAGLDMPFLSAFTVDETTTPAMKQAALGRFGGSQWARDIDNETNRTFVQAFEEKYGYAPSLYAAQGYDAALILDAAYETAGTTDPEAVAEAMRGIEMETTRGDFMFGPNQFPVQDYWLVEGTQEDERYVMKTVSKIFEDHADAYAVECRMEN